METGGVSGADTKEVLLPKEEAPISLTTTWVVLFKEVKMLGIIAGPMIAITLSQYLLQVITMMMVGHLGELALSSSAIAFSLAGATGFSVLADGDGKCIGNYMWPSLWSQAISKTRNRNLYCYLQPHITLHPSVYFVDIHGEDTFFSWPRSYDLT